MPASLAATAADQHGFARWRMMLAKESPRQWTTSVLALPAAFIHPFPAIDANTFSGEHMGWLVKWVGAYMLAVALVYVVLTILAFSGMRGEQLRALAKESLPRSRRGVALVRNFGTDEIWLAFMSALVALIAVVNFLIVSGQSQARELALWVLACAVATWITVVYGFACRYLRAWAAEDALQLVRVDDDGSQESKPENEHEFSDFVFLSVQMSTGYNLDQSTLRTSRIRRVFTLHNVLAFVFNTVILALLVSVALPLAL